MTLCARGEPLRVTGRQWSTVVGPELLVPELTVDEGWRARAHFEATPDRRLTTVDQPEAALPPIFRFAMRFAESATRHRDELDVSGGNMLTMMHHVTTE
jgi:hypothetical protein